MPDQSGLIVPGNINLTTQPQVRNPDGSISTVRSISVNIDGREVLIPTVVGNRVVSNDEAIREYQRSGKHLGMFDSPEHATSYAQNLHQSESARLGTNMPQQIGDIKTFPNGNKGRWDGSGWEDVSGSPHGDVPAQPPLAVSHDQPSAVAPPQAPPPSDNSGFEKLITKVGLPAAGFTLGGMAGGPIGAGAGAAAGSAYGDLYNMLQSARGKQGYGEIPTPTDEAIGLGETAAGGAAAAVALPWLQKLPLPPTLTATGLGALGGYEAGKITGHPGIGTAIGGVLGGYKMGAPLLRGLGRAVETVTTPPGVRAGNNLVNELTTSGAIPPGKGGAQAAARVRADALKEDPFSQRPDRWFGGARDAISNGVDSIKDFLFKPGQPPSTPPGGSANPIPNGAPKGPVKGTIQRIPPTSTGAAEDLMEIPGVGGYKYARPNQSRNPTQRYSADVEAAPFEERQPNLERSTPIPEGGASRPIPGDAARELGQRLGVWGQKPPAGRSPFEKGPEFTNPDPDAAFSAGTAPSSLGAAKGLSADEQNLWEAFHAQNPSVPIDEWYSRISRMAPNEGASLPDLFKRLAAAINPPDRVRKP